MKNKIALDSTLLMQNFVIKTIDKLQKMLSESKTGKEYIHQIRLGIKHLRAWLILLHASSSKRCWEKKERRLFKISKLLSRNRDLQVISDTLYSLINNSSSEIEKTAIKKIRQQLSQDLNTRLIDWNEIDKGLSKEFRIIKKSLYPSCSLSTLEKGLKYTYKKIVRHGENAFSKKRNYKKLHKLREWVKHLNYQLDYIQKGFPKNHVKLKNDIDCLGDYLGQLHDLVVTKKRIKQLSHQCDVLDELIEDKINIMFNKSKKYYESIFIFSPKEFIEQNYFFE